MFGIGRSMFAVLSYIEAGLWGLHMRATAKPRAVGALRWEGGGERSAMAGNSKNGPEDGLSQFSSSLQLTSECPQRSQQSGCGSCTKLLPIVLSLRALAFGHVRPDVTSSAQVDLPTLNLAKLSHQAPASLPSMHPQRSIRFSHAKFCLENYGPLGFPECGNLHDADTPRTALGPCIKY